MSDFFQNGIITTLHNLSDRPVEALESELSGFATQRPMALVLPCLYSELKGSALPCIVEKLKSVTYLHRVVVTLAAAIRANGVGELLASQVAGLAGTLWQARSAADEEQVLAEQLGQPDVGGDRHGPHPRLREPR